MTPLQIVLLVVALLVVVALVLVGSVLGLGSLFKWGQELLGEGEKTREQWYAQEWTPEKARLELKKLERELARVEKGQGLDELQKAFGVDELVHQQIDFLRERLAQFERTAPASGLRTDPIGNITAELEARVRTLAQWEELRTKVNEEFKEPLARDPEFKGMVDRVFQNAKTRIVTDIFGADQGKKV